MTDRVLHTCLFINIILVKNYKHQDISEEEYAELVTPISPIRLSFVMNNHSPNQYDEPVDPGKGHYEQDSDTQQFIELLQSDSEIIQFEAISSLFYAINIDNAIKGKNNMISMNFMHYVSVLF